MSKETLKLALEALEECRRDPRLKYEHPTYDKAIKAIEEALKQEGQSNFCPQCEALARDLKAAKQEQKRPQNCGTSYCSCIECVMNEQEQGEPQQRTWVGLTHEEIDYQAKKDDHAVYFALGALWAEAKLKERNT
jgi:5'-deoxynucleotidase YfbR-like HD superfamily hydrolase